MASDPQWERLRADDTWKAWYLNAGGMVPGMHGICNVRELTIPGMHGTWNARCMVPGQHGI